MAVPEDYEALRRLVATRPRGMHNAIGCSLNPKQLEILSSQFTVETLSKDQWNLDNPIDRSVSVVVCCNVFHYAKDPALWISNILPVCRELWITDLIHRRRGGLEEFDRDGDCMRYSYGQPVQIDRFDLAQCNVMDFWTYDAGSLRSGTLCVNFAAVLKGHR